MAVFDTTIVMLLLDDTIKPPWHRDTKQPITYAKERIQGLIDSLEKQKEQVLIPAPVLSEVLVRAGAARLAYLDELTRTAAFRIVPFEDRAAIEAADIASRAIASGDKKGGSLACWLKVKHDRQIVAVAKAEGEQVIYSDDKDVTKIGKAEGLTVLGVADLPIPDDQSQMDMFRANAQPTEEAPQQQAAKPPDK